MNSLRARRPSPALVVSVISLVVALGGTSYAAFSLPKDSVGASQLRAGVVMTKKIKNGAVTTAKIKNGSITTVKIKNGAVTKAKLNVTGLTVPAARHADSATHAVSSDSATRAATADSASSIAYAHVLPSGALDAVHSKNVTAATKAATGDYCLKTTVAVSNATATVDVSNSSGKVGLAAAVLSNQDPQFLVGTYCPKGDTALISTSDGGTVSDRAFWVTFN
jgi:hypothetical protein